MSSGMDRPGVPLKVLKKNHHQISATLAYSRNVERAPGQGQMAIQLFQLGHEAMRMRQMSVSETIVLRPSPSSACLLNKQCLTGVVV